MCNYECCVTSKNTRKSTCIAQGTKKWLTGKWWYYGHWLAFLPCACANVYVVCMSVRRGCCCQVLNVDSTVQQWLPTRSRKLDILLSNSNKNSWNIYKLLHIFDLRSRTTIKKLFSIKVPLCITAIETSHKQKKAVQNGTTNNFNSIHFPSESRQTSHNIFW